MFTGLIEEIGIIRSVKSLGKSRRITVQAKLIMDDLKIDDSVSMDGVCQTVVSRTNDTFDVEAVEETIRKTKFERLSSGQQINLERAVRPSDRLGGHFVQGHVDCVGSIVSIKKENAGILVWVSFPSQFQKYLVNTGSVSIDGVSLTTSKVESGKFMVSVIPHTWDKTTFINLKVSSVVNLEFDIIGKYIENLLKFPDKKSGSILDSYIDQPDF